MTDNEIIKALECCSNYNDCDNCDFEPKDNKKKTVGCCLEIMKEALDLINRQKTEIEQLKKANSDSRQTNWSNIERFAETLKSKLAFGLDTKISTAVYSFIYCTIDNLVKEWRVKTSDNG